MEIVYAAKWLRWIGVGVLVAIVVAGCHSSYSLRGYPRPDTDMSGLAEGKTRVAGIVEHGILSKGTAAMTFTRGKVVVKARVKGDRVTVDLGPGTWTARSLDGRICEPDVEVSPTPGEGTPGVGCRRTGRPIACCRGIATGR